MNILGNILISVVVLAFALYIVQTEKLMSKNEKTFFSVLAFLMVAGFNYIGYLKITGLWD